jgi:hypothetical protein
VRPRKKSREASRPSTSAAPAREVPIAVAPLHVNVGCGCRRICRGVPLSDRPPHCLCRRAKGSRLKQIAWIAEQWRRDRLHFSTDSVVTSSEVRHRFVGLKLPASMSQKIYYENSEQRIGM